MKTTRRLLQSGLLGRLAALGVMLAPALGHADYRGEVGIEFVTGSVESGYRIPDYTPPPTGEPPTEPPTEPPSTPGETTFIDDDYSGWEVNGQLFFEPVDTSKGPFQLAEFLDRASSVSGRYGMTEIDDSDVETEYWDVLVRAVVSGALVLEAGYGQSEIDAGLVDTDGDLYHVAVGYYVATNTQVRLSYDEEDLDGLDYERVSIDVEHVQQLENGMTWQGSLLWGDVSGDGIAGGDDGSDLEVGLSLFFNDNFGVGVDWQLSDRDFSGDSDFYALWANYFPTDKISLELAYYSDENDDFDAESDGVVFEAKYRF